MKSFPHIAARQTSGSPSGRSFKQERRNIKKKGRVGENVRDEDKERRSTEVFKAFLKLTNRVDGGERAALVFNSGLFVSWKEWCRWERGRGSRGDLCPVWFITLSVTVALSWWSIVTGKTALSPTVPKCYWWETGGKDPDLWDFAALFFSNL